jgi:hypothetical protein
MSDDTKQPPIIDTEWGPVTESARKQAELNIARDPDLKRRMIEKFGEAKVRAQYPRAFEGEDETQA